MSVRPRQLSNRFTNLLGITHFIRIPLLNQFSSSQIQDTLWHVANDPVAATIPPRAYQPLQSLSLSIASLSLPTEDSRNRATSLLQELGKNDWRELFSKVHMLSTMRSGMQSNNEFGPRPLIVDLVGIGESVFRHTPSRLEKTMRLYTFIREPVGLLESFCTAISQKFFDAGLEKRDPLQNQNNQKSIRFVQAAVIDTKGLRSGIPKTKPTLRHLGRLDKAPRFDASKALLGFNASCSSLLPR